MSSSSELLTRLKTWWHRAQTSIAERRAYRWLKAGQYEQFREQFPADVSFSAPLAEQLYRHWTRRPVLEDHEFGTAVRVFGCLFNQDHYPTPEQFQQLLECGLDEDGPPATRWGELEELIERPSAPKFLTEQMVDARTVRDRVPYERELTPFMAQHLYEHWTDPEILEEMSTNLTPVVIQRLLNQGHTPTREQFQQILKHLDRPEVPFQQHPKWRHIGTLLGAEDIPPSLCEQMTREVDRSAARPSAPRDNPSQESRTFSSFVETLVRHPQASASVQEWFVERLLAERSEEEGIKGFLAAYYDTAVHGKRLPLFDYPAISSQLLDSSDWLLWTPFLRWGTLEQARETLEKFCTHHPRIGAELLEFLAGAQTQSGITPLDVSAMEEMRARLRSELPPEALSSLLAHERTKIRQLAFKVIRCWSSSRDTSIVRASQRPPKNEWSEKTDAPTPNTGRAR